MKQRVDSGLEYYERRADEYDATSRQLGGAEVLMDGPSFAIVRRRG